MLPPSPWLRFSEVNLTGICWRRRSNIDASPTGQARGLTAHGAAAEVARIVAQIRLRWPRVRLWAIDQAREFFDDPVYFFGH
jgi:hypothetical protein